MIVNLDKIQAVVVLQKENKNKNTNQTLNIENFTFFFHNAIVLFTKVTRNNIVWKLARGYCLCSCKTFLLVLDSTECTKKFFTEECRTLFVQSKMK